MAKTHVANVADVAFVGRNEAAKLFARLDDYVSSAGGELGLLSMRPSENTSPASRTAKAQRRAKRSARNDRKIGGGVKGELLRSIYVRLAMWMMQTNAKSAVVAATDEEIAALLPYLVGNTRAKRIAQSERERRRMISQMAFDWRAVIGDGATRRAEDAPVNVTFHLAGGGGERRFWFTVDVETSDGLHRLVPPPVLGARPPVDLTDVVKETMEFRAPYMQWAEKMLAAARNGDRSAIAAVATINAAKNIASVGVKVLAIALFATLLFFALPVRDLHAKVVEVVTQWVRTYIIKNETPDYGLPQRLRVEGQPIYEDQNFQIHKLDEKTLVITLRKAEELARTYHASHRHDDALVPINHIEWEWRIRPAHLAAPIYKRTENPQLRIVMDRPDFDVRMMEVRCGPLHVHHAISDPIGVGVPSLPPTGPPTPAELDERDLLVIADPTTHDRPSPKAENEGS